MSVPNVNMDNLKCEEVMVKLSGLDPLTPCLQITPRMSGGVAHLGRQFTRVRRDRPASGLVVVKRGGQQSPCWPLRSEAKLRCGRPALRHTWPGKHRP